MSNIADIFVGFDQREAVAYHTFVQSIIDNSSMPVRFFPLNTKLLSNYEEVHKDGSNDFIYSRFLVPHLMNYKGWAIYADGDMVCLEDIKKLWDQRDKKFAVQVVKHNYKTKIKKKYFPNISPEAYWTSKRNFLNRKMVWTVNFMTGHNYSRFHAYQQLPVLFVQDR